MTCPVNVGAFIDIHVRFPMTISNRGSHYAPTRNVHPSRNLALLNARGRVRTTDDLAPRRDERFVRAFPSRDTKNLLSLTSEIADTRADDEDRHLRSEMIRDRPRFRASELKRTLNTLRAVPRFAHTRHARVMLRIIYVYLQIACNYCVQLHDKFWSEPFRVSDKK